MTNHADLIVTGGKVYTVNPAQPWAEAFAVKDGRVLAVGSAAEIAQLAGPDTVTRDLAGGFAMPGMADVHTHHALAGQEDLFQLRVPIGADLAGVVAAVAEYAKTLEPGAWIVGGPWSSELIPDVSTAAALAQLDEAADGRPVMLSDDSHHNRWVSSKTLELAGIGADLDGVVLENGAHTGVLLEAAGLPAARLFSEVGGLNDEQEQASAKHGMQVLNSFGVTAHQDAGVSEPILKALQSLDARGEMTTWTVSSMLVNDEIFGAAKIGDDLVFDGEQYRSEHHRPDFIKIFLDGVPPTRTGAFIEPYLPDEAHGDHHCGHTLFDPAELADWLLRVAAEGISAKVHCTGDASVNAVLNAVEKVREAGFMDTRYQVAHGQFVHEDDIERFAALGVAADISPFLWMPGPIAEAIAAVIGRERVDRMHPNRDLLTAGAILAGGSDWPVSPSPNGWEGIHGLVTRQDPSGSYPGTLGADQALTLDEAIAAFTIGGVTAMGLAAETGTLEAGKSADFIVLNRNPFDHPATELADTKVDETWFAGAQVFAREG